MTPAPTVSYLGEYFTAADTMAILQSNYSDMSRAQLLDHDILMTAYFGPNNVAQVRQLYAEEESDDDDFDPDALLK